MRILRPRENINTHADLALMNFIQAAIQIVGIENFPTFFTTCIVIYMVIKNYLGLGHEASSPIGISKTFLVAYAASAAVIMLGNKIGLPKLNLNSNQTKATASFVAGGANLLLNKLNLKVIEERERNQQNQVEIIAIGRR